MSTFLLENLLKTIHEVCSKCKACKLLKRNKKQYGKLPPKEAKSKLSDYLRRSNWTIPINAIRRRYDMSNDYLVQKDRLFTRIYDDRSGYGPDRNL